jgi:hypothetical protein
MGSPFLLEPTDPSTSIITILAQRFWKGPIHPRAWKGNSAKFGCSKQFSEASTRRCRVLVGNSSASLAPYLLDDGRGGLYLVEHRIRSSLQDLVEVPRLYGRAKHNNRDAAIRPA